MKVESVEIDDASLELIANKSEGDNAPSFQSIHTFVMFNFVEQKSIPVGDHIKKNLREVK